MSNDGTPGRILRPKRSAPIVDSPPTSPHRKSRTSIPLKNKMNIISDMEKGKRPVDIARDYGISASTATYIYQNKYAVIDQYEMKFGGDEEERAVPLAQALLNWFQLQIDAKVPVSDPRMRRKAEQLAAELGFADFCCTDRWLTDFNAANNIVRDTRPPVASGGKGRDEWFHLHEGYEERSVYVAGATALLYDTDLGNYNSKGSGGRCISLLAATNVTGTHKYRLTVVGPDSNPAAFEDVTSLPVCYVGSHSCLVTRDIVQNFISQWDKELQVKNKQIIVLLGNEDIYKNLQTSSCIKCINTGESSTSTMFQNILNCLKYHYRRLQIMRNLSHAVYTPRTTLLDAVRLLNLAWNCVTGQMIYDAFHPTVYGCLYFDTKSEEHALSEENNECSLARWAATYDIPLAGIDLTLLDRLLLCDLELPCVVTGNATQPSETAAVDAARQELNSTNKPSAFDAFDAAKRLMRYFQSVGAPTSTLEAASTLENHAEYGVLMEMYEEYKRNAETDLSIVKIQCQIKTESDRNE